MTNAKAGPSKRKPQHGIRPAKAKKLSEKQQLEALERSVADFTMSDNIVNFSDLPLSEQTKRGLKKGFFVKMTDIQRQSIPTSLKGKDVLGAARTGSGKTLAFLVPVLDLLVRQKWGPSDGLGALIISPTRELAVQIFEVLRSIGGYHSFSAGMVIGGKNLKDERDRLSRMNILVATPGRLLQHMDQTFGFECDNLQVLVLDEADRILDMGFSKTLSALLSHLPKSRQTLLFSATQTQSVADLARLSLKDPVSIGINAPGEQDVPGQLAALPKNLEQHYLSCTLDQKLSVLWGFIKTHLQSKIIVFISSCKQVRFVYETFCNMHPGMPLIHLHGKQKQTARLTMYNKFTTSKHAVLFATDIAARGLDFPSVDWVLQLDAPEDADTYIHRVGRTARYESKGKAILFLMPSEEEGMLAALKKKGIEIQKIKFRANKTSSIQNQLQSLAFQDPEIKYLGQRAFVSYLRSIYLHKDKSIFKLSELPVDEFAESLGLPGTPKIKFLNKEIVKQRKNQDRTAAKAQDEAAHDTDDGEAQSSSEEEEEEKEEGPSTISVKPGAVRTKYDRMFERKNQNILSEHYAKIVEHDAADVDDDDDLITLKRVDHELEGEDAETHRMTLFENLSNRKMKLSNAKLKKILNVPRSEKLVFDESGVARIANNVTPADQWVEEKGGMGGVMVEGKKYAEGARSQMTVTDAVDKEEAREKKREKKRKRKQREAEVENEEAGEGIGIAELSEDDGYVSPEFDLPSSDDEDEPESPPPLKRARIRDDIEDDEELALRLLRR